MLSNPPDKSPMALAKFAHPFPNGNMPRRRNYKIGRTGAKIKTTGLFVEKELIFHPFYY